MLRCQCPSVCPSLRLSVTFVHCGHSHRVQWIPDIFACLDRWMSAIYWQRLTRIVGWDDAGISGGRGRVYGKIGNCSDITYFTYFRVWTGNTWQFCLYQRCWHFYNRLCWVFFSNLSRKCISKERFVLELPTSRSMLATARPSCKI